jgi:hypothetical protein
MLMHNKNIKLLNPLSFIKFQLSFGHTRAATAQEAWKNTNNGVEKLQ